MKFFKQLFSQPKGTLLLCFVQMWNRFSYYGMRALLVLFMLHVLHFTAPMALGVYAIFCALIELGGVLGTLLATKFLGLRHSILIGGWIILLGHLALVMGWFFPGLALLIVGSSLFSTNINALMGDLYTLNDDRRASGFTLFYMGINIGALLATLLCGFLAITVGWNIGFGVAAMGMLLANIALLKYRHLLQGKGEAPKGNSRRKKWSIVPILMGLGGLATLALLGQSIALYLLPILAGAAGFWILRSLRKKRIPLKGLGITLAALVLFFAAEEQFGSSLMVYADKMTSHTVFGLHMASTSILALNPIVIILFGALAIGLYSRMRSQFARICVPFAIAGIAFASLALFHLFIPHLSLTPIMGVIGMISFAELFVGPMCYSTCSEVAAQAQDPKVMGLAPIGFAMASLLGGGISKLIATNSYNIGFFMLGVFLLICGLLLSFIMCRKKDPILLSQKETTFSKE